MRAIYFLSLLILIPMVTSLMINDETLPVLQPTQVIISTGSGSTTNNYYNNTYVNSTGAIVNNKTCAGTDKFSGYDNVTGVIICTADQTGSGYNDGWINNTIDSKILTNNNSVNNGYTAQDNSYNVSNNNYVVYANTTLYQILNNGSYFNTAGSDTFSGANYTRFLTLINMSQYYENATNTFLKITNWNATNTSYLEIKNWNATNTTYDTNNASQNNARAIDNTSNNNYIVSYVGIQNNSLVNYIAVVNTSQTNYDNAQNTSVNNYIVSNNLSFYQILNNGSYLNGASSGGGFTTDQNSNLNTTTMPTFKGVNINWTTGSIDAIKFNSNYNLNWTIAIQDSGDTMKFISSTGSVLINLLKASDQVQIKNLYAFGSYTGASAGIFKGTTGQTVHILDVRNSTDESLWNIDKNGVENATRGIKTTNITIANNISVGQLLTINLYVIGGLPTNGTAGFCGSPYNGTIMRNSTGTWGCGNTMRWKNLF